MDWSHHTELILVATTTLISTGRPLTKKSQIKINTRFDGFPSHYNNNSVDNVHKISTGHSVLVVSLAWHWSDQQHAPHLCHRNIFPSIMTATLIHEYMMGR